jgi:hypothetical protein
MKKTTPCKHVDAVFLSATHQGPASVCMDCEKQMSGRALTDHDLKEAFDFIKQCRAKQRKRI